MRIFRQGWGAIVAQLETEPSHAGRVAHERAGNR